MRVSRIVWLLWLVGAPVAMSEAGEGRLSGLTFKQVDSNGDGYISLKEASRYPALAEVFDTGDGNDDELIDRKEFNRLIAILSKTGSEPINSGEAGERE